MNVAARTIAWREREPMRLIRRGNTWIEPTPNTCPKGHTLRPNRVTISWDGTQRTYRCATCDITWKITDMLQCPECKSEDDLRLVGDLDDGTKEIYCDACDYTWIKGEPTKQYRNANSIAEVRKRFPSTLDLSEPAKTRADHLKREFLQKRPEPDPRVAIRWAQLRELFSEAGLAAADPTEFKHFANENLGVNPGNMSVFNDAWNEDPADGARRVRQSLQYLLYPTDNSYIEDRLTRLITGGEDFGMRGFREALLTKVLCIVYPERFLPIVKYTGSQGIGSGKKEIAAAVYNLKLPAPASTNWTIGRLIFWSNDLLVELLGEGFTDLQHGSQFLWWAREQPQ